MEEGLKFGILFPEGWQAVSQVPKATSGCLQGGPRAQQKSYYLGLWLVTEMNSLAAGGERPNPGEFFFFGERHTTFPTPTAAKCNMCGKCRQPNKLIGDPCPGSSLEAVI